MAKKETVEDVIRMSVRVTKRMREEGVQLHWTVTMEPCDPWKTDAQRGDQRITKNRGTKP